MVQRGKKKAVNPPWSNTCHSPSCPGISVTGPLGLSQKNTKTTQLSAPLRDAASSLPGQGTIILRYRDTKRYRNRKSSKRQKGAEGDEGRR